MSFQAYLTNIEARTGKSPDDFHSLAAEEGVTDGGALRAGVKGGAVVQGLKDDFGLRHGHARAVVALLKGHRAEGDA
jgi:hypothetical protein